MPALTARQMVAAEPLAGGAADLIDSIASHLHRTWSIALEEHLRTVTPMGAIIGPIVIERRPDPIVPGALIVEQRAQVWPDTPSGRNEAIDYYRRGRSASHRGRSEYPFIGGPANGRVITTDGQAEFYVPVHPPLRVSYRADEPDLLSPTPILATYVLNDGVYRYRGEG